MHVAAIRTIPGARTTSKVVRAALRPLTAAFFVLALTSPAVQADTAICPPGSGAGQCTNPQGLATDFETGRLYVADHGNNRIGVFSSTGAFEMAFGWGVADGSAKLQSCGPKATPPTATCKAGLEGGGAGESTPKESEGFGDIAVDNDPASPSHHDIYVLDGSRIQKFDPDGNFLLAFGGGVIAGGAKGSGNLVSGSKEITAVKTSEKAFEISQTISGTGIPPETKILALGPGTVTLSKPASTTGTGVALGVATGAGNVPANEVDKLISRSGPPNLVFTTPNPSPSKAEIGESSLSHGAGAAELQAALEALPNLGAGNVKVTGEKVSGETYEYTIEFLGSRFADTDVQLAIGPGLGNREVLTDQNGSGGAEICTAAIAESCGGGVGGRGHGQFAGGIHLAVGPGGTVYVADCTQAGPSSSPCEDRLQKFDPEGHFVEELALPQSEFQPNGLAADSSGDFYVSVHNAIRKYDPAGNPIAELPVGGQVGTLAIDAADDLFSAERDQLPIIAEFDSSGNTLRRFGYGQIKFPGALAPDESPSGDIYSAEGDGVFRRSLGAPGPVVLPEPCKPGFLGNTKATLFAEVNPEGKDTTVHFQYVDRKSFDTEDGFKSKETKVTPETPLSHSRDEKRAEESIKKAKETVKETTGEDKEKAEKALEAAEEELQRAEELQPFVLREATGEASLKPETEYVCRVIATNADGSVTGQEGSFTSKAPLEIGETTVSDVTTEEATLNATVDPLGIPTSGFFEYVTEATYLKDTEALGPEHGFDHAVKAPAGEPLDFGAGEGFQLQSVSLTGLAPATSYRFRAIATDPYFPTGFAGPTEFFRTFGQSTGLPDDRAWELVSPGLKNSAEVAVPVGEASGLNESERTTRVQGAADSGEALTYTSWTSFGQAEAAPATSQYLSKRTPGGWTTENVSPRGFQAQLAVPPYTGFSPDLGFGALHVSEPSLTPDCPEGREGLYLRDGATGALRCLTPEAPNTPAKYGYCFIYAGASQDASRAFFAAVVSYAGAPIPATPFALSLYEWHEGQLHAVSVLPGESEAVAPTAHTAFGPASSGCQWGQTIVRHAVSADGTRAIWTYAPEGGDTTQLLDRINGTETVQLDAKQGGSSKIGGKGVFWAASTDGSVVYFTDAERLVTGSRAEEGKPDLYRYDFGQEKSLADLTKASAPADVQGVVGVSDDGSYLYFVAKGVLSGEEQNQAGERAEEGKFNLYLNHEGKTIFIARLSAEDRNDWETQPKNLGARVTPDGRHLAFISIESQALAHYNNLVAATAGALKDSNHCQFGPAPARVPVGPPQCPQAFLYDANSGALTCASCNPAGSRPLGPTSVPSWGNVFEGPRFLSDDGSRLFFESYDALAPGDESQKRDVYEFERPGTGCAESAPSFDPSHGGCHFLISSGRSEDENYLVDASSDGRDVFFSTRDRLTGWDGNENFDVYDARQGGGFPEPPESPACVGEGCKSPVTAPPAFTGPPRFEGPGNPSNEPGRPKKKHHSHSKKHKKKRHSHKRRAAR